MKSPYEVTLAEISGWPDEPPSPLPSGLINRLESLRERIRIASTIHGSRVDIDPFDELTIRARLHHWTRDGARSLGGSCVILAAIDGFVAVNLARPDDHVMVAAILGLRLHAERVRTNELARVASELEVNALVSSFADTGVPVSYLGETQHLAVDEPVRIGEVDGRASRSNRAPVVVDLSSLWAGPLCSHVLARAGFDVLKVESTERPDGTRFGNRDFFSHLNGDKRQVSIDFHTDSGVTQLRELISRADVVIEGSRPRALEQLGIDAIDMLATGGPSVWLSITGHGREIGQRDRVGFGDDCAVAGGLVTWGGTDSARPPAFLGDAVADPLTGLLAAATVLEVWANRDGSPCLLDAALARSALAVPGPSRCTVAAVAAGCRRMGSGIRAAISGVIASGSPSDAAIRSRATSSIRHRLAASSPS